MIGVIQGFAVIWTVIAGGYVLGRLDVLGPHGQQVLSRAVFFIGTPCLMMVTLSETDLRTVFSTSLLVAAASAISAVLVYLFVAKVLWRRDGRTAVVGGMAASLVNAGNLGIPIAVYVLGNVAYAAPVLIFQLAFYTPLMFTLMDIAARGKPSSIRSLLGQIARNPILIGSLIGLIIAYTGWHPPSVVMQPFELIGGIAVPGALLAFGISLCGSRPLQPGPGRADVVLASTVKLIVHPVAAFLIAHLALGLSGHALFAVVVTAALPTAQNVFIAASRFDNGVTIAKDTVLVTTVVAVPALLGVAALLA